MVGTEIVPSTSKFSFANSETTTVHQDLKSLFSHQATYVSGGGHCGTRTSSYLVLTATHEELKDAVGDAS